MVSPFDVYRDVSEESLSGIRWECIEAIIERDCPAHLQDVRDGDGVNDGLPNLGRRTTRSTTMISMFACSLKLCLKQDEAGKAAPLPQLPPHARYIRHDNSCFDWGTYGWALQTGAVEASSYQYIVLVNSSVRGPFLPPYWPVSEFLLSSL